MNIKNAIFASLLSAASISASAQAFVSVDAGFVPAKTRAEVMAELAQAHADGSLTKLHSPYMVFDQVSTKSRTEVVGELERA